MLDQDSNSETEDPAILEVRKKYLKALGVGLGIDEQMAEQNAARFINTREMLSHIDASKRKGETDPHTVSQIESVGSWFLEGEKANQGLKYTVGSRVLTLLRESPESGYFTNLRSWVDYWTDGTGGEKFQQSLETPKPTLPHQ